MIVLSVETLLLCSWKKILAIMYERKEVLCFGKQFQILLFSARICNVFIDNNVDLWWQIVSR